MADLGYIQRIILFGSQAAGTAHARSDIDLMVLVEPVIGSWSPLDNVAERKRLERAVGRAPARVDLWVRTTDQYEEARDVIGGIEHAANRAGVVVASRPARRRPVMQRSRDDIRRRNVCDRLEDSRRLLGRAVMGTFATVIVSRASSPYPPEHYAWRSAVASMSAIFVWRQVEPPSKYDERAVWLRLLGDLEPRVASELCALFDAQPMSAMVAHAALVAVVVHLASSPQLQSRTAGLLTYLAQPVERLGNVPPLKS
jgi:predicted nucleotidyltransferase